MHLFSEINASSSECIFAASTAGRIIAAIQLHILLDNRFQLKKTKKNHTPPQYLRCYTLQLSMLYISDAQTWSPLL